MESFCNLVAIDGAKGGASVEMRRDVMVWSKSSFEVAITIVE